MKLQELAGELKRQGFSSICFWFPCYGVGGGALAFYRFAVYLKKKTNLKVSYVNYEDSYLSEMLCSAGVRVIPYLERDDTFALREKCVIVTNSTRPILLQKMRPDNRLLFWHWETIPCAWDVIFLQDETQDYFQLCKEKRAMVFHDWSSWDALSQDAGFEFEKAYLPAYVDAHQMESDGALICEEEMHLTWLGRLVSDKIYSLFSVIQNLDQYDTERKKVLHIIGDGRNRKDVEQYCLQFRNQITFDFRGTLTGSELEEFLVKNTDVLYAMGTSVLEGAARKLPAAVVILEMKPIEGDEFFWLFHSKEYCCGVMTSQMRRFNVEYSHFRDMMDDIFEYGMKREYGERSFRYYEENHADMGKAVLHLLDAAKRSALTMRDLEQNLKYIPYSHVKVTHKKFLGRCFSNQIKLETGGEEK